MPTPLNSTRLLRLLISRHRALSSITYKKALQDLSEGKVNSNSQILYRGLVNDLISLLKELRETNDYEIGLKYSEILDEVDSCEGSSFKERVEKWIQNVKTTKTQNLN